MSFLDLSEKTPAFSARIWSLRHTMEPNPPVSPTHRTSPSSYTPLKPVDAMRRARALHATQQHPSALGLDTLDASRSMGLWSDIKYIASSGDHRSKVATKSGKKDAKAIKSRLFAALCATSSSRAQTKSNDNENETHRVVLSEKSPLVLLPAPVIYSASDVKLHPVSSIAKLMTTKDSSDCFFAGDDSSPLASIPSNNRIYSHRRVPVPSLSSDDDCDNRIPTSSTISRFPVTPNTPVTPSRSRKSYAPINALGLSQIGGGKCNDDNTSMLTSHNMPLTPPSTQRFDTHCQSLRPSPPRRHMRLMSYDASTDSHQYSGSDEFEGRLEEARRVRHSTDTFGPAHFTELDEGEESQETSSWYSSDEEDDNEGDEEGDEWDGDDEDDDESSSEEEFDRVAALLRHAEAATPMTRVSSEERLRALENKYGSAL